MTKFKYLYFEICLKKSYSTYQNIVIVLNALLFGIFLHTRACGVKLTDFLIFILTKKKIKSGIKIKSILIVNTERIINMDGKKKGAPKMTDEERAELVKKLDDNMEKYLSELENKAKDGPGYQEGWNEENWEAEMEKHPFFASNDEIIEDAAKGQLDPLMEGIQLLKYSADENTPEQLALNYKDDGNFQFKLKKYRLAVAAYTEGIKCKSKDDLINVQLITNRAAAQFHLGNYRSSFNDCRIATKLKPDHFKAVKRGAICCYHLKRLPDCIKWSEKALGKW